MQRRSAVAAVFVAAALLALTAPAPGMALGTLRSADTAADPLAPVLALVSLSAWGLAAWLAVAVLTTAGSHLPGQLGRALAALARRTAPRAVRRSVEVALGLTVAVGVLATPAAAADGVTPVPSAPVDLDWGGGTGVEEPAPVTVAATDGPAGPPAVVGSQDAEPAAADGAAPAGQSPGDTAAPAPVDSPAQPADRTAPDLDWAAPPSATPPADATSPGATPPGATPPSGTATPAAAPSPSPSATPPVVSSPPAPAPSPPAPSPSSPAAGTVVVRPGDTLWDLAAAELRERTAVVPTDAQVARAWPSWWAANRDVVGADPHLLLPGTRLTPPAAG